MPIAEAVTDFASPSPWETKCNPSPRNHHRCLLALSPHHLGVHSSLGSLQRAGGQQWAGGRQVHAQRALLGVQDVWG